VFLYMDVDKYVAVCCTVLQCVAVCCSVKREYVFNTFAQVGETKGWEHVTEEDVRRGCEQFVGQIMQVFLDTFVMAGVTSRHICYGCI